MRVLPQLNAELVTSPKILMLMTQQKKYPENIYIAVAVRCKDLSQLKSAHQCAPSTDQNIFNLPNYSKET